jgi:DNA primase
MISEKIIQEIINRIDIVDILGNYIKLKKRGANFLGLCPFHNEKTPSFTVSPAKGIYKCFGCGKSGNTITFLMEHEKYSYVDALRFLAAKYQIEIQETGWTQEKNDATALHILNQFAAEYFNGRCSNVKDYFTERKIGYESVMEFMLGHDDGGLVKAAKEKQFSIDMLRKAGLATEKENDSYRGRLIFPIQNNIGKVIGFGARKLADSDFGPKYINTPENDAYNKSKVLYGIFQAAKEISSKNECIMVEGYTDVISLHQGNIKNVVSSSGTSLTIGQLRTIKKYTTNLSIIYDGDEAGHKAALRGLDLALTEGIRTKGVILPTGHDPDSYMNAVGPEAFAKFIQEEKKDIIFIQTELLLHGSTDPAKRSDAINIIAQSIAKLDQPEDFSLRTRLYPQVFAAIKCR